MCLIITKQTFYRVSVWLYSRNPTFYCSPMTDIIGFSLISQKLMLRYDMKIYFFKLFCYGIEASLLRFLKNFSTIHPFSSWQNVTASVPQSSVLRPLSFLIYINNLPQVIASSYKIFADGKSLFSKTDWEQKLF